ncbi:nuclear transport factor 2 family protein [Amycolatopsis rhizosphaerae]|uniref:Nuclear transport factor 2 family protein n=1 Tax=Amycolatopsis rhizosphaerae TaxID=2053003 RepID=A0A558BNP6_9PSEU|nr:nuclear transport factor 2 family protein [Amycolatopsis rhizosphaerae]TVT38139.1 nuclear transport factor 2 family protein [Amycolatopsis rhizosphaerae]
MASTVERFRAAVEQRDRAALEGLFAPGVRFFSPVKFTPFEGLPTVLGVFGVLLTRVFDEFRYVGEMAGTVELDNGEPATSHLLVFRAVVGGKQVHGIDLIQLDEAGLIGEFTVMVRPQRALTALSDAVLAGLVAEGLVPPAG